MTAGAKFDAVIILDWSASKVPKRGADSIWWAEARLSAGRPRIVTTENPSTRATAMAQLETRLKQHLDKGRRVLVGFDFPDGYPKGFAAAAGFHASRRAPWRSVWRGLAELLEDHDDNANNRFQVAGNLNKFISGQDYPFWGTPRGADLPYINDKKPSPLSDSAGFAERRLCETWVPKTKTCWQLCYTGSVGSQALLGIARMHGLRFNSALADHIKVWPFETGLQAPDISVPITLAEVYPSLFALDRVSGTVKDERQVKATALQLLKRSQSSALAADFTGPPALTKTERRLIEREEGWILGAGTLA